MKNWVKTLELSVFWMWSDGVIIIGFAKLDGVET